MTPEAMRERIVRYGELKPCKTAFIDAHTPGSDQKENFTIIGGGVSESPDQHVHIADTPGFNIGAAGQPPKCRNSLHVHTTAEVFFVLIGTDYGMIMAVLGGDDAGGGVDWAPQVIEEASKHGLVLGDNSQLYDTKKGESLPAGVQPMPVMSQAELAGIPEFSSSQIVPHFVARYHDLVALSDHQPAKVIGADAVLKDRPGFDVELLTRHSISAASYSHTQHVVLMVMRGHWRIAWDGGETTLAPGDTCAVPPGLSHSLAPSMSGEASLYRVIGNDDPAGLTHMPAALAH